MSAARRSCGRQQPAAAGGPAIEFTPQAFARLCVKSERLQEENVALRQGVEQLVGQKQALEAQLQAGAWEGGCVHARDAHAGPVQREGSRRSSNCNAMPHRPSPARRSASSGRRSRARCCGPPSWKTSWRSRRRRSGAAAWSQEVRFESCGTTRNGFWGYKHSPSNAGKFAYTNRRCLSLPPEHIPHPRATAIWRAQPRPLPSRMLC